MNVSTNKDFLRAILFAVWVAFGVGQTASAHAQECTDGDVVRLDTHHQELAQSYRKKLIEYSGAMKRKEPSERVQEKHQMSENINSEIRAVNSRIADCAKRAQNALAMYYFANESMRNGDWYLGTLKILSEDEAIDLSIKTAIQEAMDSAFGEAAVWYRNSADRGVIGAMYALGFVYAEGKGVHRSEFLAVEWYNKAALSSLAMQDRGFAVACLEKMTKLAPTHPLTMSLTQKIYGQAN